MKKVLIVTFLSIAFLSYSQDVVSDTSLIFQTNSDAFQLYGKDAYKMLEIGNEMLEMSGEIEYERGMANSYNTIALAYMSLAEYEKSVENFLLALDLYEKNNAERYVSSILNNMGVVYYYIEDHNQSLTYHIRALSSREHLGDSVNIAKSFNNIGIAYKSLGQLNEALLFYKRALAIKQALGDKISISNTLNNIGNVYLGQSNLAEAQNYFYQSLVLDSLHDKGAGMATSYLNLGTVASKMRQFKKAEKQLKRSITLANKYEARITKMLAYEQMSNLFESNKNFEEAFFWTQNWISLKDSLDLISNASAINDLESKYENEKIKVENELLKEQEKLKDIQIEEQRWLIAGSILLVGSFILSGFFLFKAYRMRKLHLKWTNKNSEEIKRKNELISDQNKELSQINEAKNKMFAIMSHDIKAPFNNLISFLDLASNKMLTKEEIPKFLKDIANEANHVSDLISNVLEWMKTQMNGLSVEKKIFTISPLVTEVFDGYKLFAKTKNIKFKNLTDDSHQAYGDDNLTKTIIRNLVANAIKYTENGTVGIASKIVDDMMHVSVFDSGVGMKEKDIQRIYSNDHFSTVGTSEEIGTGLGLLLIKEFVVKNGGILKIKSELGIGSSFTFTMPLTSS